MPEKNNAANPVIANTRAEALAQLRGAGKWDFLIIGGGATGLGAAVDAASRGYRTLLVEAKDFASGTSSCSTKLVHGGVRYMRNGDFHLVREALHERFRLVQNAPHLVHPLAFIIPAHSLRDRLLYGIGLKLYDTLAGWNNLGASQSLDLKEVLEAMPTIRKAKLQGGIRYWDGQFDDARLAITLMRTASDHGALCLNYLPVTALNKENGKLVGATLKDAESGEVFTVRARAIINATGVHVDALRRLDVANTPPLLTPSQGIHLVFDADILPGNHALLVPETEDGRVVFAVPWHGKVLIGTTDTPLPNFQHEQEPQAQEEEIDFLLRTAATVLERTPERKDIRSVFAGLRPLLHPDSAKGNTAALSREHAVLFSDSGLITVTGGKWTTYRRMAEEVIDRASTFAKLPAAACCTHELKLHGATANPTRNVYGTDSDLLHCLPGAAKPLHDNLPYSEAMVRYACRFESARTIEDILARRTRACFLNATAAQACIPRVAEILTEELQLNATQIAALIEQAQISVQRFKVN